jgi:N-acetyl-1-D-myo-inositol-2-amino-2-deoxy-alpha-D-glucopyranoside deacetylase
VVAAVAVLGTRGPSGSVLFPDDGISQVWAVAPAILVAAVVVWPRFARRAPGAGAGPDAAPAAGSGDRAAAGTPSRAA